MNIETWLKEQVFKLEKDIDDYLHRPLEAGIDAYDDYVRAKGMVDAYRDVIEFLAAQQPICCEHEFSPVRNQHTIYKSCRKCGYIGGI